MRGPAWRWTHRVLTALFLLILLLLAGAGGTLWWSMPPLSMSLSVPGLSAPVAVDFDAHGVPRIRAANEVDAAAALGFVHARERMFQMELMRRAASGRLSELAGAATLPLDRQMRVLGLARAAEADFAGLSAQTRAVLDAYARGVNAWIARRGRFSALETIWFGAPEPWQSWHSLLWAKTMGMWLSENWRVELARHALAGKLAQHKIDQLWAPDPATVRRPDAALPNPERYADAAASVLAALPAFPADFTQPPAASNEWAVDGRHSATGAPLLAGDPHLAYAFPGIWYLARIETPGGVLVGATAPGVPILIMGHNGKIAWTFTTTGADVQDVFIETPAGDGMYATPDGPQPFITRIERIVVRGQPDELRTVRETRHGPVISDLTNPGGPILAVAMVNLLPGDRSADGMAALTRARTVDEAGAAASGINGIVQNLLVADQTRIGLFVTGRIPIRRAGDGAAPVPGADGAHDWVGFVTGKELPRYVDPPSGRLVNANERIAPADFPVFLGRDWFEDWRARRIGEMLDARAKHNVDDFLRMQVDAKSVVVTDVLPLLLRLEAADGNAGQALALLRAWDGMMTLDAPQPLIFAAWLREFRRVVLERAGVAHPVGPLAKFVRFALTDGAAEWCGTACDGLLHASLDRALALLSTRFGPDPARWRWGQAHQTVFAHPLLRHIPGLAWLSTFRIATPGDDGTVFRGGMNEAFEAVHGAGYRGVYDLADLDQSRFIVAPGQSGHPLSRHAGDLMDAWRDGRGIALGQREPDVPVAIILRP